MRLVSRLASPAAIVALALAITAAPASAEPNAAACSDARRDVAKFINEVRFFNSLANTLELLGLPTDQATLQAEEAKAAGQAAEAGMGRYC